MKKRRLLCVTLSLSLIFTTMFAGAGSAYAALYPEIEEPTTTSTSIYYSNTAVPDYANYTVEPGGLIRVVPVVATDTGWMYLDVMAGSTNEGLSDVYLVDKYVYDATTTYISTPQDVKGEYFTLSAGEAREEACKIFVTAGQTYYVLMKSGNYSTVPAQFSIRTKIFTTGTKTISANSSKWNVASGINEAKEYGKATWFKLKPTKTGVMRVDLKQYGYASSYGKIRLYNSSKKAVSETVRYSPSAKNVYFGVKKGNTYYLKVTDCYGSSSEGYAYGVRCKMSSRVDRVLSSKSKARTLKRKADATRTLFVASTAQSADWYKFNVTSKRTTQIKVDTSQMTSGELYISIYKGKKKIGSTQKIDNTYNNSGKYAVTYGTTYGKATKGTYYVKIVKSKTASGSYTVRYVK